MYRVERVDGEITVLRMKDMLKGNPQSDLPFSFEMKYEDFGKRYIFDKKKKVRKWKRRTKNDFVVVRLYMGYPGTEYFYLRKLLRHKTHLLHIGDLKKNDHDSTIEYSSYRESCVAHGLVDSGKEFYECMHDAHEMGFGSWKLLGLFAQMLICSDVTNVDEIWNGPPETEEEQDELTCLYPNGFKHLMMLFPKEIKRQVKGFNHNFHDLPNDILKQQCEQYTLRKLASILERAGKAYPGELPELLAQDSKEQTIEWLNAHNYSSDAATKIYESHTQSNPSNISIRIMF
jgi:hypothetical protein